MTRTRLSLSRRRTIQPHLRQGRRPQGLLDDHAHPVRRHRRDAKGPLVPHGGAPGDLLPPVSVRDLHPEGGDALAEADGLLEEDPVEGGWARELDLQGAGSPVVVGGPVGGGVGVQDVLGPELRVVEAELEAERQRIEDEARQQAAVQQTATAVALEKEALEAAATPTPPPPTPTAEPTAPVIQLNTFVPPSETDSLPVVIKKHPVEWPTVAQKSRRQGVIILQATVNADGRVEDVKVLRADDKDDGIPEAAIEAARKYHFKPGTKDGVRIKTYATITETYRFVYMR